MPNLLLAALGLVFVAAILMYATLYFGLVTGQEFSPDTFKRRSFTYHQIPLVGWQVTPIWYVDQTNDLEQYVVTEKLLPPVASQARWDLVHAVEGTSNTHGEARILCRYLDAVDKNGAHVWLDWSQTHKDLAKILWPAITEVAREQLYSFVPTLLRLARSATAVDQFQSDLDQTLADHYLALAQAFESLGRHEEAVELYSAALVHAPDLGAAAEGRARSVEALGHDPASPTAPVQAEPSSP